VYTPRSTRKTPKLRWDVKELRGESNWMDFAMDRDGWRIG